MSGDTERVIEFAVPCRYATACFFLGSEEGEMAQHGVNLRVTCLIEASEQSPCRLQPNKVSLR